MEQIENEGSKKVSGEEQTKSIEETAVGMAANSHASLDGSEDQPNTECEPAKSPPSPTVPMAVGGEMTITMSSIGTVDQIHSPH